MYNKKFDSVENIGPAFENLENDELMVADGQASEWVAALSAASAKVSGVAVASSLPCGISASVASVAVTAYSLYQKYN